MCFQEVDDLLSSVQTLSAPARLLHAKTILHLTDMVAAAGDNAADDSKEPITEKTLIQYVNAQTMLLNQVSKYSNSNSTISLKSSL